MRHLMFVVAAAALITGPAHAQQGKAARQPVAAAAAQPAAPQKGAEPTHEMCRSVMGRAMDGKPVHDHGREKTGAPTWPNGKRLTPSERETMHQTCAAKMRQADAAAKAK